MDRRKNKLQLQERLERKVAKNQAEQLAIYINYTKTTKQIKKLLLQQTFDTFLAALKLYNTQLKELSKQALKLTIKVPVEIHKDISFTKALFLVNTPQEYQPQNIAKLLDILEVDLANFKYTRAIDATGKELEFSAVDISVDLVYRFWSKDQTQHAIELFKTFIEKGLPANGLKSRDNVLMYALEEYPDEVNFIKLFIESGSVNINTLTTPKTEDFDVNATYYRTPFNVATKKLNKEMIFLLLESGANPNSTEAKNLKLGLTAGRIVPQEYLTLSGESNANSYFAKLDIIVSEFYLKKLEKLKAEVKHAAEVIEADTTAQMAAEEPEIAPVVTMAASSADELLTEYADFKEELSQNTDLPQEARTKYALEALFLRYIQTKDKTTKTQIDELLTSNPSAEARKFYNQILSEVVSSDEHVGEVFASQDLAQNYFELVQKLLHFQPQTAHLVSVIEEEAQEMVLVEGVYKIQNAERIFISVAQELLDSLAENQRTTIKTFLQNPKFIGAKSKAKNGIKHYSNDTYKLKTAKTDIGLVATQSYIDDEGNTLIIFDQICSHKDLDRADTKGFKTKLSDISDMIFAPSISESAGSDSDHDSDVPPPPTEPYPDGEGTIMLPMGDMEFYSG